MYHAANVSDLDESIDYIVHCRPYGQKMGVGVSLGAGVLTNYLASKGENCPLRAAVGVACHFDLGIAMKHMGSKWFGFYDLVLGYYTRLVSTAPVHLIDKYNSKKNKRLNASKDMHRVWTLTQYIE